VPDDVKTFPILAKMHPVSLTIYNPR